MSSVGTPHAPETPPATDTPGPVTTMVSRRVKPGHEAAYEEFLDGIIAAARSFPGHLGAEVFRPSGKGGEYRVVCRFDSAANLRRWLDSDEHRARQERLNAQRGVMNFGPRTGLTGMSSGSGAASARPGRVGGDVRERSARS